MQEWVAVIERVGYPIASFLLLFFSVRQGLKWYAVKILEPKAQADVALLDSVRETNDKNADNQSRLVQAQLLQSETLAQLAKGQETQTQLLRELAGRHVECPMRKAE